MTVGEKIRQRRIELGMTQEELALKLGYKSRSSVNKVELASDLTLKTIRAYAKVLNMDVAKLMGWEEIPTLDARYSFDTASLVSKVRNDSELIDALQVYFSLPADKKKYVTDLIKMLGR